MGLYNNCCIYLCIVSVNIVHTLPTLYKKDLHDQDNHDGVITDLEPDILECEVQWALESITMNKAGGGFELFHC